MEQHLVRTEAWSEHLGKWRCHIQSVEHLEDLECLQVQPKLNLIGFVIY